MRQHICPFDKIEKNIFVALKSSMTAYGSSHKNFSAFIGNVEKQSVEIKLAVRSRSRSMRGTQQTYSNSWDAYEG